MTRLTTHQIIAIHQDLQQAVGGNPDVRDEAVLNKVLEAPFVQCGGWELYPTVQMKAARLCHGFVCSAPMAEGNARTGLHLMLLILDIGDVHIFYTKDELRSLAGMLKPSSFLYEDILSWILTHQLT